MAAAVEFKVRAPYIKLFSFKPANGFEPMTFALQKRCSTAELSRQSAHSIASL